MKSVDDTKLGGIVKTAEDWNITQEDLDLEDGSDRNGMKVSRTKYEAMHWVE